MTVTVDIPDTLAKAFAPNGGDVSHAVLEAMALEGYRSQRLGESAVRRLLGFETRMEVHGFLKEHGVYLHYTMEDVEKDTAVALETARRFQAEKDAAASAGLRP